MKNSDHPVLVYDGVCGLCNRLVQLVLRHDRRGVFRFASLQSGFAGRILARHGKDTRDLDTVYVVVNYDAPEEALFARSDAIQFVFTHLGGMWRVSAIVLKLLPDALCDFAYNTIARRRYRFFGRSESCILPAPEDRARFLDGE